MEIIYLKLDSMESENSLLRETTSEASTTLSIPSGNNLWTTSMTKLSFFGMVKKIKNRDVNYILLTS